MSAPYQKICPGKKVCRASKGVEFINKKFWVHTPLNLFVFPTRSILNHLLWAKDQTKECIYTELRVLRDCVKKDLVVTDMSRRGTGGVNPLSATKICVVYLKEKNIMQNILKRNNMYLEGFQVILHFFHSKSYVLTILNLLMRIEK